MKKIGTDKVRFEDPKTFTVSVDEIAIGLKHESALVRKSTAKSLGNLELTQNVFSALLATAGSDPEPEVRRAAVIALGKTGGASAIPHLKSYQETEKNDRVQAALVEALGKLCTTKKKKEEKEGGDQPKDQPKLFSNPNEIQFAE